MSNRMMSPTHVAQDLGAKIRRLRTVRNLTQADVLAAAAEAGWQTDVAQLSRLESGKRFLTVDELVILAGVLNVDPWALARGPACLVCADAPPGGFTCNACGTSAGDAS